MLPIITKITSDEHEVLMETMRENVSEQAAPKAGMFWLNPERNRLVGVREAYASELDFNEKGRKTVKSLHNIVWNDVREDALAGESTDEIWQQTDYMVVPRGRIFQIEKPDKSEYFEILVGSWIEKHPDAMQVILDRFNLNNASYDFIISGRQGRQPFRTKCEKTFSA
jgi:hypothetical protein